MKVKELIKELKKLPQDLEVAAHYDGDARLLIDQAYFGKVEHPQYWEDGFDGERELDAVVLCEENDVYSDRLPSKLIFGKLESEPKVFFTYDSASETNFPVIIESGGVYELFVYVASKDSSESLVEVKTVRNQTHKETIQRSPVAPNHFIWMLPLSTGDCFDLEITPNNMVDYSWRLTRVGGWDNKGTGG
jgi:hypothetical protein